MEPNDASSPAPAAPSEVTTSGVWPPPTGGPPSVTVVAHLFLPARRPAQAILVLLTAYAALAVLGIAGALLPLPAAGRQIGLGIVALLQAFLLVATAAFAKRTL